MRREAFICIALLALLGSCDDDAAQLTGPKKCGGFHPDFAVGAFSSPDAASGGWTLLCFGCREAGLHSDHIDARMDVPKMDDVRAILRSYKDQRPGDGVQ